MAAWILIRWSLKQENIVMPPGNSSRDVITFLYLAYPYFIYSCFTSVEITNIAARDRLYQSSSFPISGPFLISFGLHWTQPLFSKALIWCSICFSLCFGHHTLQVFTTFTKFWNPSRKCKRLFTMLGQFLSNFCTLSMFDILLTFMFLIAKQKWWPIVN